MSRKPRTMRIDFAPRSLRRTLFHAHPALLAVGALGVLLCAGAVLSATRLADERRDRAQQLQHVQERADRKSTRLNSSHWE